MRKQYSKQTQKITLIHQEKNYRPLTLQKGGSSIFDQRKVFISFLLIKIFDHVDRHKSTEKYASFSQNEKTLQNYLERDPSEAKLRSKTDIHLNEHKNFIIPKMEDKNYSFNDSFQQVTQVDRQTQKSFFAQRNHTMKSQNIFFEKNQEIKNLYEEIHLSIDSLQRSLAQKRAQNEFKLIQKLKYILNVINERTLVIKQTYDDDIDRYNKMIDDFKDKQQLLEKEIITLYDELTQKVKDINLLRIKNQEQNQEIKSLELKYSKAFIKLKHVKNKMISLQSLHHQSTNSATFNNDDQIIEETQMNFEPPQNSYNFNQIDKNIYYEKKAPIVPSNNILRTKGKEIQIIKKQSNDVDDVLTKQKKQAVAIYHLQIFSKCLNSVKSQIGQKNLSISDCFSKKTMELFVKNKSINDSIQENLALNKQIKIQPRSVSLHTHKLTTIIQNQKEGLIFE